MPIQGARGQLERIILHPVDCVLIGVCMCIFFAVPWTGSDRLTRCRATRSLGTMSGTSIERFAREFNLLHIESLVNRDCDLAKVHLANAFRGRHGDLIGKTERNNREWHTEIFKICKVGIVEVHDFMDNALDNSIAYIKGEKKYYVKDGEPCDPTDIGEHEELFSFRRS